MTVDDGDDDDDDDTDDREHRLIRQLTKPTLDQPTRPKTKEDEALIRLALHQSPFFTCLDEEQVARFVEAAQLKTYTPGEVVILEGYIDDDTKDGDGDKLDTKGLLRRLLSFDDAPQGAEQKSDQPATPGSPSEGETEVSNSPSILPVKEGIDHDDDFLDDENDEQYAALDAVTKKKVTIPIPQQQLESLDPTATENYGGMEIDEQIEEKEEEQVEPAKRDDSLHMSGITSYVYAIRSGSADVWHGNVNIASYGQGTIFGEGGFLFHRQHSATVLASPETDGELECWVVPAKIFRKYVLPSDNMIRMFAKHATHRDEDRNPYMTMDEFVESCLDREGVEDDPSTRVRMANTYNILRKTDGYQKISLANFCLFHLIMSRPDPEVDIAFLLLDKDRRGTISLDNLAQFLEDTQEQGLFDLDCDFIKRHFGPKGEMSIRPNNFSQFLADFQREMGRQAFLHALQASSEGYLPPQDFVRVLKTACGWRLPDGVADRLENIYCKAPIEAAEAAAIMSVKAENLKGSTTAVVTKSTTASILANIERRSKLLGDRCFTYGDFLAFQEVLQQLPGICNLVHGACAIKDGPVSQDDFKVANRVIGLGGKLSRRQVDIVFELFDLDHDGFISGEDTASVMGVDFVYKLEATAGREGKLTFAPPPDYRDEMSEDDTLLLSNEEDEDEISLVAYITNYVRQLGIGSAAGAVGAVAGFVLAPLDLVKTRMQLHRIRPDGARMYKHTLDCFMRAVRTEGFTGMYRGTLPHLIGIVPQRAFQLTVYSQIGKAFEEKDEDGQTTVPIPFQILAGGVAGACKVLFANPLDIATIEMQLRGETNRMLQARGRQVPSPASFQSIAKELGVIGYYRGASSTLWRDVPFSAMFFPLYTVSKQFLPSIEGYESEDTLDSFLAAAAAAIPSSIITTPADVIKTRLQAGHREGDVVYTGVRQCATQIYKHEGIRAFFKGAGLRALRSGPQLGLTMAAYEKFSERWGVGSNRRMVTRSTTNDPNDYRRAYPMRGYGSKAEDIDGLMQHMGMSAPRSASNNSDHNKK